MKSLKPSLDRPVLPDTHALPSPEPPGAHTRRRWFEKIGTAALMASMVGAQRRFRKPLMAGVGVALVASVLTWVVAQTVLGSLAGWGERLEAVVSLIAIGVLLLILNWFYHRVYWQENLQDLHRKKKRVLIVGVDRLLTVPAKCCRPAPPDEIVGFVTRGRGVTLHRAGCASLKRLDARRRVSAEWGESAGAAFPVDVEIVAAKRSGLLREISEVLAREKIRIAGSRSTEQDAMVRLRYTLEVVDVGQLSRVLALVREVRGVARAARR